MTLIELDMKLIGRCDVCSNKTWHIKYNFILNSYNSKEDTVISATNCAYCKTYKDDSGGMYQRLDNDMSKRLLLAEYRIGDDKCRANIMALLLGRKINENE